MTTGRAIILAIGACIAVAYLVEWLYVAVNMENALLGIIISDCLISPVWEEAAYRYGPIRAAGAINKDSVWPVVVSASLFFGWWHGDGIASVMLQGSIGMILSWVFIKEGYLAAVLTHAWYNTIILIIEQ